MSDELTNAIMAGSRHASISAETLEQMGKQASVRFLTEGIPLNESISKLAAEHSDISAEQVKRVCEFANTAVYLSKHDQSKTAGASSSYPQFQLADPSRIIQDMSDGSRSTVSTDSDLIYAKLPVKAKTASIALTELRETVIDRVFGTDPEKIAKVDVSTETIINNLMNAKHTLQGMDEEVSQAHENLSMTLKEAQAEFYHLTKQHLMNGGDFSEVVLATQSTGAESQKIAQAIRPTIERLLVEKVASPTILRSMTDGLEKIAHSAINPAHPLVTSFSTMIETAEEIKKVAEAQSSIATQYGKVESFIRENFLAHTTR